MLEHVVRKQKTFDYNYYLTKNCPLPEGWRTDGLKDKLAAKAKESPLARKDVYRTLFDSESPTRQVADFLTEFIAQVFPQEFLTGKNKKVFNKKILAFVNFNRFETFTRVTLLDGFDSTKFKWMGYKCKKDNNKYFENENNWVLWKILKWVFEELVVTLLRCYFYSTEKQKEYSRIFFYRKCVWSIIIACLSKTSNARI